MPPTRRSRRRHRARALKFKNKELWEIEYIMAAKVNESEGWEYLVKWADFPESFNSWEPAENVINSSECLARFYREARKQGKSLTQYREPGFEVTARSKFVEKAKKKFQALRKHEGQEQTDPARIEKWLKENNRTFFTICVPPQRTSMPLPEIQTLHSPTSVDGSIDMASPEDLQMGFQQQRTTIESDDHQAFAPELEYHSLFGRYPPRQPEPRRSVKILESYQVNSSGSNLRTKKRINRSQYVPALCRSVTPEPQLVPDSETTASFRNPEVLLTSAHDREYSVDSCLY